MADGKDGQKLKLNGESAGRKKKLIIIIALVLLLAGGGAGGFFFMKGSGDAKEGAGLSQLRQRLRSPQIPRPCSLPIRRPSPSA